MRKLAPIWLTLLALMGFEFKLMAQDEYPVIVHQPTVSVTVFTDWQLIKVTYTVDYLEGYKLLLREAEPDNMAFGLFEPDPVLGRKLIVRNQRQREQPEYDNSKTKPKPKTAYYMDLVYYLRHVGEKKGDILIPEQIFSYIKEAPGKSDELIEQKKIKAPGALLRYDSVLTKDADDIIDRIDFSSFKKREILWKYWITGGGFVVTWLAALFLLFKGPSMKKLALKNLKMASRNSKILPDPETQPEILEAFLQKISRLKPQTGNWQEWDSRSARASFCDELRAMLLAFVPGALASDTQSELKIRIAAIEDGKPKETLITLANWLEHEDGILYGPEAGGLPSDIDSVANIVRNGLMPQKKSAVLLAKLAEIKKWASKLFVRRPR